MIQWFKDVTTDSIVFKAFMGLMILSFGIWGIGDVIAPSVDPNVAIQGGSFEVRATELQRRYQQQLDKLRQSLGPEAASDPSLRQTLLNSTISQVREEAVTNEAALDMGINVSPNLVREVVMAQDVFKDESGGF
ncbi:MAG: SurA N-terminal domain-containing protein, partial [Rhodospirillaceae bacterium]|nr:SurA N-terminal domain-containing protein [Rhodospirillaceae bacterium]